MQDHPPPIDEPKVPLQNPKIIMRFIFGIVLPLYLLVAWCISQYTDYEPLVDLSKRTLYYGVLCALSLGSVVISFWLRKKLTVQIDEDKTSMVDRGFITGCALSELPALIGLIYFILFRDWVGFLLLVSASLLAFIFHAKWYPPEEIKDSFD